MPTKTHRLCINPECGWEGETSQCVYYKHDESKEYPHCPECHELTEEVSDNAQENITKLKAAASTMIKTHLKTKYTTEERDAAKNFLSDAVALSSAENDCMRTTTWMKPNGALWHEYESKLEPPEYEYHLSDCHTNLHSTMKSLEEC